MVDADESWHTWTERGRDGTHESFAAAERAAKAAVRGTGRIDIRRGGTLVATVGLDALDRVWTDMVATDVA